MRFAEIRHRLVLTATDHRPVGRVRDLILNERGDRVVGLVVESEPPVQEWVVPIEQVHLASHDTVVLDSAAALEDPRRRPDLWRLPRATEILGARLVGLHQEPLGRVGDLVFSVDGRQVQGLIVVGGLFGMLWAEQRLISPQDIVQIRPGSVVVRVEAVSPPGEH